MKRDLGSSSGSLGVRHGAEGGICPPEPPPLHGSGPGGVGRSGGGVVMRGVSELQQETVVIVCTVEEGKPSYFIEGVPQKKGDRARLPVGDAAWILQKGKTRVVEGSEETVSLGTILNLPGRSKWSATKW